MTLDGPEHVYSFSNAVQTFVELELAIFSSGIDLDLAVIDGTGGCRADECVLAALGSETTDRLVFEAMAGGTYFVVIDGKTASDFGGYSLSVGCPVQLGLEHCANGIDDNNDTLVDCDDESCEHTSVCIN